MRYTAIDKKMAKLSDHKPIEVALRASEWEDMTEEEARIIHRLNCLSDVLRRKDEKY